MLLLFTGWLNSEFNAFTQDKFARRTPVFDFFSNIFNLFKCLKGISKVLVDTRTIYLKFSAQSFTHRQKFLATVYNGGRGGYFTLIVVSLELIESNSEWHSVKRRSRITIKRT